MKFLILPDLHNRQEKAEKIIATVKPDKTIFLGDYFDDFGDDPHSICDTADWFHHSVNQPDRIHICGNHDLHYWFKDSKFHRCSVYEQFKSVAINDFVKKEDWEKLIFFYNLDNQWLLTHAGFHPSWINPMSYNRKEHLYSSIGAISRRLEAESKEAKKLFYKDKIHWFAMPGFARDDHSPYYGGICWCDYNEEFSPIIGVHQIFGHTPNKKLHWETIDGGIRKPLPLEKVVNPTLTAENSYNICLDSKEPGSRYYAVYEDKQLTIHDSITIK